MTTGLRDATGVEVDELDGLFEERVRARTAALVAPAATHSAGTQSAATRSVPDVAAAPVSGFAVSTPDPSAIQLHLGRSLRTAAPLLAADAATLAACGVIAEMVLRLVHPHAGPALGSGAMVALLPLVV